MPAIIILGGHRTGTSLTARLVHELGFPAAPSSERLLQPRPGQEHDNPNGYFEDIAFVRLHRRMLGEPAANFGGWRNPRRDDAEIARRRHCYRELVRKRNEHSPDWSIKDPRLCLVGDVLLETQAELAIEVKVVTTARPQTHVVASLMRRGVSQSDADRIASVFEAGRQATLDRARQAGIECLEVSLISQQSRSELECDVSRLQQFLARTDPSLTQRLAGLVRFSPPLCGSHSAIPDQGNKDRPLA